MATTARTWLDAETGRLFDNGTELEILGGTNWIGFTITRDDANNRYDITAVGGSPSSDDVSNESTVTGATVTNALNALLALLNGLDSDDIVDQSNISVGEGTVTEALNYLESGLGSSVPNTRTVTAGAGMTGGGALSADITLNVIAHADGTITVNADSVQVGTLVATNYAANTIALTKLANASAQFQIVGRKTSSGGAWEDCSRSDLGLALSATQVIAGTNLSGGGTLAADRTLNVVSALTGITSINGVTIAAPVQGTDLTNADQTLTVAGGNNYVQAVALTATRTKTLGTTGSPETGEVITITRNETSAQTMPIVNGGAGAGTLYTFPSASKRVADFRYDGTNWVLAGAKRIQ